MVVEPRSNRDIEIVFKLIVKVPVVGNTVNTPNPPGLLPFKGNLGVPTDQRKFDSSWVWTHDLRIKSTGALPTELRGQHGSRSG